MPATKDDSAITEPVTKGNNAVPATGGGQQSFDDPEYLKKWILACKKEADDATADLRTKWQTLWLLYQNEQDYSKKQQWQSQTCIPKLAMAIERASLLVEKAVLQPSKLFHLELDDEFVLPLKDKIRQATKALRDAQKAAAVVTKQAEKVQQAVEQNPAAAEDPAALQLLETHIQAITRSEDAVRAAREVLEAAREELHDYEEQAKADDERFKAHLKKTNFISAYGEMVKPALLLGIGIIKRVWKGAKERLSFETKAAENIFIAPDYMPFEDEPPRYIIEYKEMGLDTLLDLARTANGQTSKEGEESTEGPFIMSEVEKINEDYTTGDTEKSDRLKRLGLSDFTDARKRVAVLEYWGQLTSEDGREIRRDRLMMLANEKYLIRNQENPYEDKRPPYDLTIPLVYPGRGATGISMIEHETKLQWTLNNLLNLFVDALAFTVFPMFEYDPQKLQEPEVMTRIFPGKRIQTKPGTQGPVVSQVKTQGIGADAFKVFDILARELQEGTAITEFLTAMPGKQQKTLGEIEIKTTESHGYFDVVARKLEINSVRPTLRSSYAMLQQFTTRTFENLDHYQFNVGGLSLLLLQKQQMEYLMQAIALATKNPQIAAMTNMKDLWERLLGIWNLDEAHREDEPEEVPGLPPQAQAQAPPPMQMQPQPMAAGPRMLPGPMVRQGAA